MATGDTADFAARIKRLLPRRWFADDAPVLDAALTGLGSAWSILYGMMRYARAQTRIATSTDSFLDMTAFDFFGRAFWRRKAEPDAAFSARLQKEVFRPRATRAALDLALTDLTGKSPQIFEPGRPGDTGGWGYLGMTVGSGMAYGGPFVTGVGGYGSLALPFQFFVTAHRATGGGIPGVMGIYVGTGWAGGGIGSLTDFGAGAGAIEIASLDMSLGQITDADINDTIASVLPVATRAWTRITY